MIITPPLIKFPRSCTLGAPALDVATNINDERADALRDELAGRTGLTDSEGEGDVEAEAEE